MAQQLITRTPDESALAELYRRLIDAWNARDAAGMARLFSSDGNMVGFDGSQASGSAEVEAHLAPVFASHPTARFVTKVREIRFPTPGVGMLTAVAGMVPPGASTINSAVNAIQTLVAAKREEDWRIELFQNTPAAWHGQGEARDKLTAELQAQV